MKLLPLTPRAPAGMQLVRFSGTMQCGVTLTRWQKRCFCHALLELLTLWDHLSISSIQSKWRSHSLFWKWSSLKQHTRLLSWPQTLFFFFFLSGQESPAHHCLTTGPWNCFREPNLLKRPACLYYEAACNHTTKPRAVHITCSSSASY